MLAQRGLKQIKGQGSLAAARSRPLPRPPCGRTRRPAWRCAATRDPAPLDISELAELMSASPLEPDDEQRYRLEKIAIILDVPLATAKQMAFKKRGVVNIEPNELRDKLHTIANIVGVPLATAKKMASIQPGLLFDTERQAEALELGIRAICYELKAPKEEVVDLILTHQSVLHGREMHLSVADIAHLAMLRQPVGRIIDD